MVEVEMTKDIRAYEPKLFGFVTTRQLILIVIGLAYAVPLYFLLPIEDISTKVLIAAVAMMPVIMMGWVSVYGMRLEQFALQAIRSLILTPSKRKYKTEHTIDYLDESKPKNEKKVKIVKSADYPARK